MTIEYQSGVVVVAQLLRMKKLPSFPSLQKNLFGRFAFGWVKTVDWTSVNSFHPSKQIQSFFFLFRSERKLGCFTTLSNLAVRINSN